MLKESTTLCHSQSLVQLVLCQTATPLLVRGSAPSTIHPSAHPTIHLHTLPSIYPPCHPSIHPAIHLSTLSSIYTPCHPSTHLAIHLSTLPSIYPPCHPSTQPCHCFTAGDKGFAQHSDIWAVQQMLSQNGCLGRLSEVLFRRAWVQWYDHVTKDTWFLEFAFVTV